MEMGTTTLKNIQAMRVSAGLSIWYKDYILLVQQKNDYAKLNLSIPKGNVESGESYIQTAIRETFEETGIAVNKEFINKKPYIINIDTKFIQRRIVYYKVTLHLLPEINIIDTNEIQWAGFIHISQAIKQIQKFQLPILWYKHNHIPKEILTYYVDNNYISQEKHPTKNIFIYNYTAKCKNDCMWNEITLWCRGLILDSQNNIIARPMRKFFEYEQLIDEFKPNGNFTITKKIDGFLGILYWINNMPFIATRGSFISHQAIKANTILYTKYLHVLSQLNTNYTYLFEIVYKNDYLIIDYGETEDLILLYIFDNTSQKEIDIQTFHSQFPKANTITRQYSIKELLSLNIPQKEGFVLKFDNGDRVKIKFPWYKEQYTLKHSNNK